MDITNNERMRLAASAYRAYIEHAAQMELPDQENPRHAPARQRTCVGTC